MPGRWDATIKAVYAVDAGTSNTVDIVKSGTAFDILADVEIGANLVDFNPEYTLAVSVRNQSRFLLVFAGAVTDSPPKTLPGQTGVTFTKQIRVKVPGGWTGTDGDVLDVIASFKVVSGGPVNTSSATSPVFVVSP